MTSQRKREEARKRLRAYFASLPSKPYGIPDVETGERIYRSLYRAQGGRCYVCRKATGASRLLAIDHDHVTGEIRGLVCSGSVSAMTCNRLIAIFTRAALLRAAAMLSDPPPARRVIEALTKNEPIPSLVGGSSFTVEEVMEYGNRSGELESE